MSTSSASGATTASDGPRSPGRSAPRQHRTAATTAGILYITGTVAGVLSRVVTTPVRDADDPMAAVSAHQGAVTSGALLVLVMGLALAFVPVVLFPILRRIDEVLAVGYLVIRGGVETACYVLFAVGWLLIAPLSDVVAAPAGIGARLGTIVVDQDGVQTVLSVVFCVGAAVFYTLLYRSRIVPRWIAVWGLAAIPLYAAAALLAAYGVIDADSTAQTLLFAPLAVQEMVLAVWMIARGFRPART